MSKVNKSKLIAISALIISLILIVGSIYFHLQKKPHLGRINHGSRQLNSVGVEYIDFNSNIDISDSIESNESSGNVQSSESEPSDESNSTEFFPYGNMTISIETSLKEDSLNETCIQCICETVSMCKPKMCGKQSCGVFAISESYWYDAGEPIVENGSQTQDTKASDYLLCVNDRKCAETTIRSYMKKFSRDCNADGVIDCRDYISIHLLGPTGCLINPLSPHLADVMEYCLSNPISREYA